MISVITVTYNASATLPATLRSLARQTCRDFEHIVVDGASSDNTVGLARQAGAKVFSEPDNGLYDAMNKGLDLARGEYLMFLNAGDALHDDHVMQRIADAIAANNRPGMVYGQTVIVDENGNYLRPRHLTAPEHLDYKDFARGMLVCHQAMVVRADIAPKYNYRYRLSADFEWGIRVLQNSRNNVCLPGVMIDYLNEGQTTRNRRKSLLERFDIMCRYYGTVPTVMRHLGFALRCLRRRLGGG